MPSVNETRMVRVATMKADGRRFLLDSFHGTQALLWGELVAFKGLRSEHSGKLRWVSEALFTFAEEKKTVALCMALLKQAAAADEKASVRVVTGGAKLAFLDDEGEEVQRRVLTKAPLAARARDFTKAQIAQLKAAGADYANDNRDLGLDELGNCCLDIADGSLFGTAQEKTPNAREIAADYVYSGMVEAVEARQLQRFLKVV